jgi:hypothetical protein
MREVVVTAPSVWAIGIVLMASAVVWVSLFTRGEWRPATVASAAPRPGPRRG